MDLITNDIEILDVVKKVKSILWNNKGEIDKVIQKYESGSQLAKVWIGDWDVIDKYPAITIEPILVTPKFGATEITLENTYNLRLFGYLKNLQKEIMVEYLCSYTEVIRRILQHPTNLQWYIEEKEGAIYNGAVSGVAFGYKKGGAIRASQLDVTYVGWRISATTT